MSSVQERLAGHTEYPCEACERLGYPAFPKRCRCGEGSVHCTGAWEEKMDAWPRPVKLVEWTCTTCGERVGGGLPWATGNKQRAELLQPPEVRGSGVFVVNSDVTVAEPVVIEPEVKKDEDGLFLGVKVTKRF